MADRDRIACGGVRDIGLRKEKQIEKQKGYPRREKGEKIAKFVKNILKCY